MQRAKGGLGGGGGVGCGLWVLVDDILFEGVGDGLERMKSEMMQL